MKVSSITNSVTNSVRPNKRYGTYQNVDVSHCLTPLKSDNSIENYYAKNLSNAKLLLFSAVIISSLATLTYILNKIIRTYDNKH